MSATTAVDEDVLREIVRRIVRAASPERILLFGSAARGEMGPNSDIDLLVVKRGVHRRKLAAEIHTHLIGVRSAVDVVVVTPEDIERYKDSPASVIEPALREGKEIYPGLFTAEVAEHAEDLEGSRRGCSPALRRPARADP